MFFLEIDEMTPETQETLFDEILDRDVQKELENGQIINWSIEVSDQLNSRLYALWNRSAGDCLLGKLSDQYLFCSSTTQDFNQ